MNELKITLPPAGPDPFPWVAFLGCVSTVLWIGFICWVLYWIGLDQIRHALTRMSKISVAGLELSFKDELTAAATARHTKIDAPKLDRVSRRLAASIALTVGARILWADDNQDSIKNEVKLLEESGMKVERVTSTDAALELVARNVYDVVLSDIHRDNDSKAGLAMAEKIIASDSSQLIIFYVGEAKLPAPATAFGITDSPDQLVHLILDALARRRG